MRRIDPLSFLFVLMAVCLAPLLTCCGGGAAAGGGGGGTPQNLPILTAIAPSNAVVGAAAINLSLFGSNFQNGATVNWNGTMLSSSWIGATRMTATIPASDLTSAGTASVTVTNPGSGGGASSPQVFTIVAEPAATTRLRAVPGITAPDNTMPDSAENVVWDAAHGRLYYSNAYTATTPSNTIAVIDPIAGAVVTSVPAGNDPDLLSISSDSSYLWAGLDGDHAVQRFLLPGLTKDISFPVPLDSSGNPQQAVSLQAAPGNPHTLALIAALWNESGAFNYGIYAYDDATPRPVAISGPIPNVQSLQWLQWGGGDSTIYANTFNAYDYDFIAKLSVSSSGVSFSNYHEGTAAIGYTEYNSAKGLLYSYASAFDPNGNLAGLFNISPAPFQSSILGPRACTADSSLGRYYCVQAGQNEWEMWVFDLTSYALLDRVYFGSFGQPTSPITGYPHHLVRWGNAGLALSTKTYGGFGDGGFFLIDGAAVNPDAAADVSAGATTWHYSWMSSMTPQGAPAGSGDVTLTINGRNFTPESTVCWRCGYIDTTYLPTYFVNSQQLTATVPASLMASPEFAPISIYDATTNLSSTDSLAFTVASASVSGTTQVIALNVAGFALTSDRRRGLVYVATADFDGAYPDAILALDGNSGSFVNAQTVGADPWVVNVSGDGQYLYAGFYGTNTALQLRLPGLNSPLSWPLTDPGAPHVYWAGELKAAPVNGHSTAITLLDKDFDPPYAGGLVIYDDNVERPDFLGGWGSGLPGPDVYTTLAWGASDETLAAAGSGPLDEIQITSSGATFSGMGSDSSFDTGGAELHSDFGTGLIYCDDGKVADPTTGATVGNYNASGLLVPDSSLNRVFILGQTAAQAGTNDFTVESFDQKAYTPVSSITLKNLQGVPLAFVRCGTSGLAILMLTQQLGNVPGLLYLVRDSSFRHRWLRTCRSTIFGPGISAAAVEANFEGRHREDPASGKSSNPALTNGNAILWRQNQALGETQDILRVTNLIDESVVQAGRRGTRKQC